MKVLAIAQRGAKKDFIDLHFLLDLGIDIGQMINWYQEKYNVTDTYHALYSLTYFDDAEVQPMPPMLKHVDWRLVKKRIASAARAWATHEAYSTRTTSRHSPGSVAR